MNKRPRYLECDEIGRVTLNVRDFDEADRLAEAIGVQHEDGCFPLGHVNDYWIMNNGELEREFRTEWFALANRWEADDADRRRPETFTVPSYTGGLV